MTARRSVLLSAVLLLIPGCRGGDKTEGHSKSFAEKPLVEIYSCRCLPDSSVIKAYGNIEPVKKADVLPPMTGKLIRMYRQEGESVFQGDLLAELDTRALEIQLSQQQSVREGARASLSLAREKYRKALRDTEARFLSIDSARAEAAKAGAELQRMREVLIHKKELYLADGITEEELQSAQLALMEKQTVSDQAAYSLGSLMIGFREEDLSDAGISIPQKGSGRETSDMKPLYLDLNTRMELAECDLAEAELNRVERQIASLKLKIGECTISSPMNGIVGRRYRDEGELVSSEKALYTIYPGDPLHALVSLSEGDLLRVRPEMKAEIFSDAAGQERAGTVERVSPWISTESRSGELRIRFSNGDGLFRAGQFVRVEIALQDESSRITIPSSALVSRQGDRFGEPGSPDTGIKETESAVFLLIGQRIFRQKIITGPPGKQGVPVVQGLKEGDRLVINPEQTFRDGMEVRLR